MGEKAESVTPACLPESPVTFLRLAEVKRRSGYSTSGLYRAMTDGDFPRPRKRGGQSVWIESEVDAALKHQAETLPSMGSGMGPRAKRMKKPLESAA